jgi:hypothetical protein
MTFTDAPCNERKKNQGKNKKECAKTDKDYAQPVVRCKGNDQSACNDEKDLRHLNLCWPCVVAWDSFTCPAATNLGRRCCRAVSSLTLCFYSSVSLVLLNLGTRIILASAFEKIDFIHEFLLLERTP